MFSGIIKPLQATIYSLAYFKVVFEGEKCKNHQLFMYLIIITMF